MKGCDYAEGVSSAAEGVVDVRVYRLGSVDEATVGKYDVESNDLIQRNAPKSRGVAIVSFGFEEGIGNGCSGQSEQG